MPSPAHRSRLPLRARPADPPVRFSRSLMLSLGLHAGALAGAAWIAYGPAVRPGAGERPGALIAVLDPAPLQAEAQPQPERLPEPAWREEHDPAEPRDLPPETSTASWSEDPPLADVLPDPRLWSRLGHRSLELPRPPEPAEEPPQIVQADPLPSVEPAAAPAPAEGAAAVVLAAPAPDYPRISVRLGEEGTVRLELQIGADGRVRAARVLESSGHQRLDEAARAAVLAWRFRPATEAGQAVPATIEHLVTFRLEARG